ncbi:hypothetical protein [Staphylococcus caprae]|uniref:hypothetical protein n=1 Tax=Staphylococcus caprae TaxID=29380 RepID=UPI00118BB107|nr:hypothetical protein [Staphylococcus caprae]QDW93596.1 hypothetical protein DWB96_04880 [Staphylococcus caprae]
MDFELSLLIIQTITGIISLYLGYKAIKLNNEVSKNSNNNYTNNGVHNQTYNEMKINVSNEINEKKERYINYFHWIFNLAFFGTGIYTLIKMFPQMLNQIRIFDGGITFTNITKLLILSFQNALLGSLIINIVSGILLIIFTVIKPYFSKKRLPLSIIIVLTNSIMFIDLLNNNYHDNIVNTFGNNNITNFLTLVFILVTMLLVLANNMIIGIYLFKLKSYKDQLKDPFIRFIFIMLTIIVYGITKWIAFYDGLEFIKNYFN